MKSILVLLCLLIAGRSIASGQDDLPPRSQLSLVIANGMSQKFFVPSGSSTPTVNVYNNISGNSSPGAVHSKYLPLYALHLQMRYGYAPVRWLRIETGLGYLMASGIVDRADDFSGYAGVSHITSRTYTIIGNITVPLYVSFAKVLKKGNFICTLGPDFVFPVHSSYHQVHTFNNGLAQPDVYVHYRYKASDTKYNSTLGLYFKLGYEIRSINIGPVIDFFDLVNFTNNNIYSGTGNYHPYQYYAGVDVTFNFRVITKISR